MPQISEEEAYKEGEAAKECGRPISSCPYRYRNLIIAWENGWWDADRLKHKPKS